MIGIKNNGIAIFDGIAINLLVHGIPLLGGLSKPDDNRIVLEVVVKFEVGRFIHIIFKILVYGFVLPKVLGLGCTTG